MAKGIYKRSNVYWIRHAGLDGRIAFASSGSTKYRDAEALLIKRKQAIKEGKQPEIAKRIANHTFNELVMEYVKWAERQKSFDSKICLIKQLAEKFGNIPLRRFNSMMLEQYQTERLSQGIKAIKGNKPATVNRLIATISHIFTKVVEWNMVEEETLKRVRKVKLLPENNRRLRYLSTEECQRLVDSCDKHLKPIAITALNTGMQKDEVLGLKWDNIDLKAGFILLNQDQTENSEHKELPINQTLREILQSISRCEDVPYIFHDPVIRNRYDDVKRSFKTALKRAEIRDFKFHDLRHTFVSRLVMAGIDLTTVKELMGYKDFKMTLRYVHLAPNHKVKAVDTLDNILTTKSTIQKLYNLGETSND
ncbi:MAG: site-specific integrase [Candidatus Jettenia sp.]|nr:site-specific integrase [Candidatus Jettenia sp.]